jgi:plasmanylethanolamine desaturase
MFWGILQVIVLVLMADVVIAIAHWAMDVYGDPACPVLGKLVFEPNELHHVWPRAFLKNPLWKNSDGLVLIAIVIIVVTWTAGVLTWEVWVFAFVVGITNLIHRWAHQTRKENGWLVSLLQDLCLIQRPQVHGRHHRGDQSSNYAPITNFVNPVLEALNLWRVLECLVECALGVAPRRFAPLRVAARVAI